MCRCCPCSRCCSRLPGLEDQAELHLRQTDSHPLHAWYSCLHWSLLHHGHDHWSHHSCNLAVFRPSGRSDLCSFGGICPDRWRRCLECALCNLGSGQSSTPYVCPGMHFSLTLQLSLLSPLAVKVVITLHSRLFRGTDVGCIYVYSGL